MSPVVHVIEAVYWPVAFYLTLAFSIVILEPLSSPQNDFAPRRLKKLIQTFLGFGKTLEVAKNRNSAWVKYFTVPKRWFSHFYVVASIVGVSSCALICAVYGFGATPPTGVLHTLDLLATPTRAPADSDLLSILCLVLLTVQCCARLHECYCVSVFSSTGVMNMFQYGVGFAHYLSAFTVILAHTPALVTGGASALLPATPTELWRALGSGVLFGCAFLVQRHTMRRLAKLRHHRAGNSKYVLPTGGGFEYVSCPHMTAEVTMYAALALLQPNMAWAAALLFVASNQVHVALSNHRWYRSTFRDYPKDRTAIIPQLL